MPLRLSTAQILELQRHALKVWPDEACGVLAGRGQAVTSIIPLPNAAADPKRSYRIDDRVLVETLRDIELKSQSLIGFYHSHPNGSHIPSPTDVRQAYYPDALYVIVGLRNRESPEVGAWSIRSGEVKPVEIQTGSLPAQPDEDEGDDLTPAQARAVILAIVLSVMLVLVIALSLLPPAPVIPSVTR
ncbi:MAG: M67 family metallopeptidase [Anaerolineae bacterium]|nr:M67 family metallopeptidase [Anaerolineae bacterium]